MTSADSSPGTPNCTATFRVASVMYGRAVTDSVVASETTIANLRSDMISR